MRQRKKTRKGEGKSNAGEPARAPPASQSWRETGGRPRGVAGGGRILKASPYRGQQEPQRV